MLCSFQAFLSMFSRQLSAEFQRLLRISSMWSGLRLVCVSVSNVPNSYGASVKWITLSGPCLPSGIAKLRLNSTVRGGSTSRTSPPTVPTSPVGPTICADHGPVREKSRVWSAIVVPSGPDQFSRWAVCVRCPKTFAGSAGKSRFMVSVAVVMLSPCRGMLPID